MIMYGICPRVGRLTVPEQNHPPTGGALTMETKVKIFIFAWGLIEIVAIQFHNLHYAKH